MPVFLRIARSLGEVPLEEEMHDTHRLHVHGMVSLPTDRERCMCVSNERQLKSVSGGASQLSHQMQHN